MSRSNFLNKLPSFFVLFFFSIKYNEQEVLFIIYLFIEAINSGLLVCNFHASFRLWNEFSNVCRQIFIDI